MSNLKKEISTLKELKHKNIVRYVYTDISSDNSGVDIIMEYVPGGSVRHLLNKFGKLHEKTVQKYTKELLEGLTFLHSKGIIHRDIKCANLLVDNDGIIKLSDFGASKRLGATTQIQDSKLCKSLRGSPYWMAPEVVKRSGHSYAADIWSVGCVAIEMIAGTPPWSNFSKDVKQILQIITQTNRPPEFPNNISRQCTSFLTACLQLNPDLRPKASELLTHPFITEKIDYVKPEEEEMMSIDDMIMPDDKIVDLDPFGEVYDITDIPQTVVQYPSTIVSNSVNSSKKEINDVAETPAARRAREEELRKIMSKQAVDKAKREAWERELQLESDINY